QRIALPDPDTECCPFDTTGKTLRLSRIRDQCPAHPAKIFIFPKDRTYDLKKPSRARYGGRFAIVNETRRGWRWTCRSRKTCGIDAYGQVVWSWFPDAGIKRMEMIHSRWGLESPVPQGEREVSRKAIAQGVPDRFGLPDDLVCASTLFSTQGLRVRPASGAPCALCLPEGHRLTRPGREIAPRECELLSETPSSFRGASLRQIGEC